MTTTEANTPVETGRSAGRERARLYNQSPDKKAENLTTLNHPPRILIVDDDVNITYAFKLGLERRGFLVDVFNDAAEMLDQVKPNAYQVAIFDFRMPKMSGLELFKEFRKLNRETPICFFTALDLVEQTPLGISGDAGAPVIIKKPVSIVRLAEILQEIVEPKS